MRAILIEPPYGEPKMEPTGLLYLATVARRSGFHVDVLYESPLSRYSVDEAARRAIEGHYQLVGVTAMTPTLPRALAILRSVKMARPGTLGVLGGYHATVAHDRLLERHREVDVAVRGEGEYTFVELLERLRRGESLRGLAGLTYREAGQVVPNELRPLPRDLDALPFPDRALGPGPEEYVHFYDDETGRSLIRANVTSSRGCPYGCAFCVLGSDDPGSPISMRRWRGRSPENVVAEIEQLVRERDVGCIAFAEDNFTVSPRRLEGFADLVLERGLRFTFTCDSRANQVCRLERVLPKLRRAGLRKVEIGIESGSQAVLDRFAKGTRVEHNVKALQLLAEHRITPRIDFIMFDRLTSYEDLWANLRFLRAHAPPGYDHNRTVYQKLELHPGTELQRQFLRDGPGRGSPDEVIPYEFEIPGVGRLFSALDRFYWDHQSRLDELKKRSHYLQVRLGTSGRRVELRRLAMDLVYIIRPSHALPLRLFEALLREGAAGDYALADLDRVQREFAIRVDAFEREFEDILRKHDLVGEAREAYAPADVAS